MIDTKDELYFFLEADKFALGKKGTPRLFGDEVWKFQIALRKCEYFRGRTGFSKFLFILNKLKKQRLGFKLGFDIPENVFNAGLRINHFGNITVNGKSRIGKWCDIHQGVNIGESNPEKREKGKNYVPTIGDNVWIGPGAKIYGDIVIGSQVQVGANAVVGKSFREKVTIAGVPAKIIIEKGTSEFDVSANINRAKEFFIKFPKYQKYDK